VWDAKAADSAAAYTFTVAPLIVKNEVIVGISGGEYGVRGFIDAYDADTGQRRWRFETVPGPGPPGTRDLDRGFVEDRRRTRLDYRFL